MPRMAPDIGSMTMIEMAEARVFSAAACSSCSTMNWIDLVDRRGQVCAGLRYLLFALVCSCRERRGATGSFLALPEQARCTFLPNRFCLPRPHLHSRANGLPYRDWDRNAETLCKSRSRGGVRARSPAFWLSLILRLIQTQGLAGSSLRFSSLDGMPVRRESVFAVAAAILDFMGPGEHGVHFNAACEHVAVAIQMSPRRGVILTMSCWCCAAFSM